MFSTGSFWVVLVITVVVYWLLPARVFAPRWLSRVLLFPFRLLLGWFWRPFPDRIHFGRIGFLTAVGFVYLLRLDSESTLAASAFTIAFYFLVPYTAGFQPWRWRLFATLVLASLAYLAYVKYLPQLAAVVFGSSAGASALGLLGVSYYTFKLIHYAVEVSRGSIPPHGLGDFLNYIFLFPIFSAGPIERFDHYVANRDIRWSWDLVPIGVTRIFHGVIKRYALVEAILLPMLGSTQNLGDVVAQLDGLPFHRVWWFLILTYLIAYLDFSAYTDIAIGASRLFGIQIQENFRFPIFARSISDFWRRWHMTLAGWCQSYVYLPLIGLTRNPYLAVYATFLTMGIWHAASLPWIAWGLYHATGIAIHNAWTRWLRRKKIEVLRTAPFQLAAWLLTFLFVSAGYAFTSAHEVADITASLRTIARAMRIDVW